MKSRSRVAALVALAAVAVAAAGCGGSETAQRRDAVAAYIERVNAIQKSMNGPLTAVSTANRDFAKGTTDLAGIERRLARARGTLAKLRRRLGAVKPPPDAKRLHALVLDLADRELELAGEVDALARFAPGFAAALKPLAPAGRELKTALAGKGDADAKAAALERYAGALGGVLRRLAPLRPPPASRPVYEAQTQTVRRVRSSVAALAGALRQRRAADLPKLLHRFDVAAISNRSTAAQKAQIAAVEAYNARIHRLDAVMVKIARERTRLQGSLR